MLSQRVYGDPDAYTHYYITQAGHGLDGFHGTEFMHGSGLAGLFRGLFRRVVPLFKKGVELVKPHVKTAARNIAKDVVTTASTAVMDRINRSTQGQAGSGVVQIRKKTRKRKRERAAIVLPTFMNKVSQPKRRRRQKTRSRSPRDIF